MMMVGWMGDEGLGGWVMKVGWMGDGGWVDG